MAIMARPSAVLLAETVENAVHKMPGFGAREILCQVHRLVDRHGRRNILAVEKFPRAEPEDVALHGAEAVEVPIVEPRLERAVERGNAGKDPAHAHFRKFADGRRRDKLEHIGRNLVRRIVGRNLGALELPFNQPLLVPESFDCRIKIVGRIRLGLTYELQCPFPCLSACCGHIKELLVKVLSYYTKNRRPLARRN